MKIICNREKLLSAFQTVASVTPARSPKPILQNAKIEANNTSVTLMGTDLEIGIRYAVAGVEIERAGAAVLPVGRFGMILRESLDESLLIDVDSEGISVTGERNEFKLPAENPEEFPSIPPFQETVYYEVSARLLREMIRRTVFAIDTESSRYALGGVLLELEKEKIVAVGTDGRRLAKMEGPTLAVGNPEGSEQPIIVPGRAMQLFERALSDADAEIQLTARDNEVLVKSQSVTVYARLLEGRFPRWQEVFPVRDNAVAVEMPVGPVHAAVRQAAIVTSDESRGIDFTFHDGTLVLAGQTADVGQSRVDLPVAYDGDALTIMLDPRYISEFLKVLDPEKTFSLELKDAQNAAVCRTDDGYSYVIMPLAKER